LSIAQGSDPSAGHRRLHDGMLDLEQVEDSTIGPHV
jgi:hypothetical protein